MDGHERPDPAAGDAPPALALDEIAVRFGSAQALDGARVHVRSGTVHAVLGENGAGKTTLMRVAYGLQRPDRGTVRRDGRVVRIERPADAIRAGIGMVHQHFTNVPALTVAENVALGGHGMFHGRQAAARVRDIGRETGLALEPGARVSTLAVAAQQRLEIIKALAGDARILILDEPTAVLAPAEADGLLEWLRTFADSGRSVVLITHKLREALAVADDVTVLRRGRTVLEERAAALDVDAMADAMLGSSTPFTPSTPSTADGQRGGEMVCVARAIRISGRAGEATIDGASFSIAGGDIVGVAALENAGHLALVNALAGRRPVDGGSLEVTGPVAFIPEDRQREALIGSFSLSENVALRGAAERRGRFRARTWRATASALVDRFDVRGAVDAPAATLSGGNQQKLVLARELHDHPRVIVAVNPTRGLDIRAASAVLDSLRTAARRGAAVIVHSSDLDELLTLATRVLVVHAGRVRETARDREAVGRAMLALD